MNLQTTMQPKPPLSPELLARFIAIVGQKYAVTDARDQEPYLVEMRDLYRLAAHLYRAAAGIGQGSGQEIFNRCNETKDDRDRAAGGQYRAGRRANSASRRSRAVADPAPIKIREVDPVSNTITGEAGVTLQRTREASAAKA